MIRKLKKNFIIEENGGKMTLFFIQIKNKAFCSYFIVKLYRNNHFKKEMFILYFVRRFEKFLFIY